MEGNLEENYLRAVSRGQNELIGKLKMVAGDVIIIRGKVMEYTYIPTGIKSELVIYSKQCDSSFGMACGRIQYTLLMLGLLGVNRV